MISWTTYLTVISIAAAAYYSFVLLVYYRKEIFRKIKPAPARLQAQATVLQADQQISQPVDAGFQPTSLLDEIHAYMNQAAEDLPIAEEEVVAGVKLILGKYPPIEDSFLRLSINDIVVSLAESKCEVEISPVVLSRLWV